MILTLHREPPNPDCTLGILTVGAGPSALKLCTMERPWVPSPTCKGGMKGVSCVPVGTYQLVKHSSQKYPRTWALVNHELDVVHHEGDDKDPDEDRVACLFHTGNYVHQSKGCILVGLAHTKYGDEYMVMSSVRAWQRLMDVLPWETHELLIHT